MEKILDARNSRIPGNCLPAQVFQHARVGAIRKEEDRHGRPALGHDTGLDRHSQLGCGKCSADAALASAEHRGTKHTLLAAAYQADAEPRVSCPRLRA